MDATGQLARGDGQVQPGSASRRQRTCAATRYRVPIARLDDADREIRLLVDHREDLVAERTRIISRLRWHLHELDPAWRPPTKLDRTSAFDKIGVHVATFSGLVADLTVRLVDHLRRLTTRDR